MKGWWVRYKFVIGAAMAYSRRARGADRGGGDLGVSADFAAAIRPYYLRRLLKGLSRRRPASPQKTKSRAEPGANRP